MTRLSKEQFTNPYSALSADGKIAYKNENYASLLTNGLVGMFEYEKSKEYENIDDATIELAMIYCGFSGFWWKDKKKTEVVCGLAYPGGALDENGVGTLITGNLLNGKGYKGINGIDAVCGWNNAMKQPDSIIAKFADYLAETDTSQEAAIRFTRNGPIYSVKNSKIAVAIKNALANIFKGEPTTIVDNSITLKEGNASIEAINLTDPASIDKLQYLSTYHNDLLRRAFTMYGQALGEGVKLAQQSVAEISANVSSSFVLPLDRLKQRTKMCKELEKVFGGSIKVRFTEPWRIEFEKWSNVANNAVDGNFSNDEEVANKEVDEDES